MSSQSISPLRVLVVAANAPQLAAITAAVAKLHPHGVVVTCSYLHRAPVDYHQQPCDIVLVAGPDAECREVLDDLFAIARGLDIFLYAGHLEANAPRLDWSATQGRAGEAVKWSEESEGDLAVKLHSIQAFKQVWTGFTETTTLQHAMLEHLRDGAFLVDEHQRIAHANQEACRLLNAPIEALLGQEVELVVAERFHEQDLIRALPPLPVPGQGDWRMVLFRPSNANFELQADTPSLFQDVLTGLPTQILLHDRLNKSIQLCSRYSRNLGVLKISIGSANLKDIIELKGRNFVDVLARELSLRLMGALRLEDSVSRETGTEFVALLQEISDHDDAVMVAKRVQAACNAPIEFDDGTSMVLPVNIGIACFPAHGKSTTDLLARAQVALSRAEHNGLSGGSIETYAPETRLDADKLFIERKVLLALTNNELVMYYQPKVDVKTSEVTGVEALLRWNDGGVIRGPNVILQVASDLNVVTRITKWALRESAKQGALWRAAGHELPIAVNVPPADFSDELLTLVGNVLAEFNLPPHLLELEVTELAMGASNHEAQRVMKALADIGVRLHVDDFGTGYSSMERLKSFPVATLKIDRSFIQSTQDAKVENGKLLVSAGGRPDIAILQAVLAMADSMQLKTVVEGVESRTQLDVLEHLGVDIWQGFLATRALPPDALIAWRNAWHTKHRIA
ncbi:diguanylate cyclase [Novimethylophilus kurashikiensis]|uniref:Diguanylate cyclase n=1 Tax=Novimethylophilus kurashikiensis TaxID=1825523 RepID=A0A2R5F917_9PROT|nr:bifunctional diguanylate cyclase/phosphodiesterase [Novimethylophilus kurashikiensis]GBG14525.1 diguanylate cyclase [Novimethylophilus kurashikiensis]